MTEAAAAATTGVGTQATTAAAATTTANTEATASGTTAATSATTTSTGSWYDGFSDAELKGWVANKGFQSPLDMAMAHRNLEKLVGSKSNSSIELPNWDDPAAVGQFYDKLGRPKSADEYDLPKGEGIDENFVKWARGTLHEVGVPGRQAKALVEKFVAMEQAKVAERTQAKTARVTAEVEDLKKTWGAAFNEKSARVDQAVTKFGLSQDDLVGLRDVLGPKRAMMMLDDIGSKLGEDTLVVPTSGNTGFGAMTPDQAKARITELRADKDFVKRYSSGDVKAKDEMARLHRFAYPD